MKRLIVVFVISFLSSPPRSCAQANFRFFQPVVPPRNVQVVVHRGMAGAPKNSAATIATCARNYCEWAEVDLRLTKDGRHVVIHDARVDATTDGTGPVNALTLAELKQLDSGSRFAKRFVGTRLMSLTEALALASGKVNLCLDCKQVDPERLVEEIVAAGMQRQVVVFAEPDVLAKVRSASEENVACMAKYRPATMPFDAFVRDTTPAAVEVDADAVTAELCERFHAAGIKVQAKALGEKRDNPEMWGRVIDAGVDWIRTDVPAEVLYCNARRTIGTFPVKIAAHRGASRFAPENTLPAIRKAARLGLDFCELDVRTTRDGKHVLMHNSTVDATTDGTGRVRDMTFAEISTLSAGRQFGGPFVEVGVPSFDEGLAALGDEMAAYLDAKDVAPEDLVAAIHRFHLEKRHVVYQSIDYCERLGLLDASVRTMPPLKGLDQLEVVAAVKPYAVDASWSVLSEEMIAACHRRGFQVFSDALGPHENVEEYEKAIRWGIDCIQTDHPLRVLRAVERTALRSR